MRCVRMGRRDYGVYCEPAPLSGRCTAFWEVVISDLPIECLMPVPEDIYTKLAQNCQRLWMLRLRADVNSAPFVPVNN